MTDVMDFAVPLKAWIAEHMQGGCKILSLGSACQCPICLLDHIVDAAEGGPQEKAWRCFHCNEVFTDETEAREHFGAEMYRDAACRLPPGADIKHIRGLEARVADLQRENDCLDNEARLWHESEADRVRRIGNVQWWQEMDSREGERLVLQERIVTLETALAEGGCAPQAPGWQPGDSDRQDDQPPSQETPK
jgi:hypothetical protein